MKALACVNSKAEKVAGSLLTVNLTGWGFGSEKMASVDVYSEWSFLTWPDDTSDVPVVIWALPPVPLALVTIPKSLPCPSFLLRPQRRWHKRMGNPLAEAAPSPLCHSFSSLREAGPLAPQRSKLQVWRWSRPCPTALSLAMEAGLGRGLLWRHGGNASQSSHRPFRHAPWNSLPSPTAIADLRLLICYFGECLLCAPINVIALFCWRECRSPCHK